MIKKFKEFIEESIFNAGVERNQGNEIKKEDDINLLDRDGMCNYILDNYTLLDKTHLIENTTLGLMIPITKSIYLNISYYTTPYKEQEKSVKSIWISSGGRAKLPIELFNYLRDTYNVTGGLSGIMLNSEHKEITNTMCVDILDNLLKYIPKTILVKNIKESIFNTGIERNQGNEVKKEDDVNLMDCEQFCNYIKGNYSKPNDFKFKDFVHFYKSSATSEEVTINIASSYWIGFKYIKNILCGVKIGSGYYVELHTPNLIKELDNYYNIAERDMNTAYDVMSKSGEISNKDIIKILDIMIDNCQSDMYVKKK